MRHTGLHGGILLILPVFALCLFLCPNPAHAQITFSPPTLLNTNGTTDVGRDQNPQISTDGAGNWVTVWDSDENLDGTAGTDVDIFVSRSTDTGATWTAPALVNTNVLTPRDDRGPSVATDSAGNWVAVWQFHGSLAGSAPVSNIIARSIDAGATWTQTGQLNVAGENSQPRLATDSAGNWVAVWQSNGDLGGTFGTDHDIFVSRSTNAGATRTAPALLNTNGMTDTGFDGGPNVTTDSAGNWVAVWYSSENLNGTAGTDHDIFVARSIDAGATWTAPKLLNTNGTADSGTDRLPLLATDSAGNWVAVWQSNENLGGTADTDEDVFVSRSIDAGATWTAPAVISTTSITSFGRIIGLDIATDDVGNWVVLWCPIKGSFDNNVLISQSTDNGATWTTPALIDASGTPSRLNLSVRLATDHSGNWVAVWSSQKDLDGTAGTDADIFVSIGVTPPGLPATGGWARAMLVLLILGIGWSVLRRSHRRS